MAVTGFEAASGSGSGGPGGPEAVVTRPALFVSSIALSVALLVVVAGACADDGNDSGVNGSAIAVVIDSDGAFDDLKAIVFLLERPDVEVLALTMSGTGVAHCPDGAENVSAVLERIGAPDIPVSCGRTTPLAGNNEAPAIWRAAADSLGGVELPDPRPLAELAAPDLLAETISSADRDVVLVALGPLTNIAEAIETDPSFLDRVAMVYLMGGAVDVGGNVMFANPAAEFNIWADPHAAAIVFDSDVPITLVPLDATNAVPVTPYLYEAVAAHRDVSPVSQFVADYLAASPLFGALYQWDELAAVVSVDETVATIEERSLAVVEEGGAAAGATIDSTDGRSVRVAVDADRHAFEDLFYEAIIGTSDTGVPSWEPDARVTWDGTACEYTGPDPLPDRLLVQIDNMSSDAMALLTGSYAPGTTTTDWDIYQTSGSAEPPDWWTQRDLMLVPAGAHDVWVLRGSPNVTALCFIDSTRLWEVAGPSLADSAGRVAAEIEQLEATVSFDDETCSYQGPVEVPDGAQVTFELDTNDDVSLMVIGVDTETPWDEMVEYAATHSASAPPAWVDLSSFEIRTGPGSLALTLLPGDYLVACITPPEGTDTVHPATLIEVTEG